MSEWRTIDSAPKDGTNVLLYMANIKRWRVPPCVGFFRNRIGWVSEPGTWQREPTHWMPLPAPPSAETRGPIPPSPEDAAIDAMAPEERT